MKNVKKIISVIMTFVLVFTTLTVVNATGVIITDPISPDIGNPKMFSMTEQVLGMVYAVCLAVSFGMLIFVGIKYMMASANEKADVKNASIKYVIGAIVLLGATTLFNIIISIAAEVGASL